MINHVMIGPNTLITTVGHPFSPKARRGYMAHAEPVRIGNDVWNSGNVAMLSMLGMAFVTQRQRKPMKVSPTPY